MKLTTWITCWIPIDHFPHPDHLAFKSRCYFDKIYRTLQWPFLFNILRVKSRLIDTQYISSIWSLNLCFHLSQIRWRKKIRKKNLLWMSFITKTVIHSLTLFHSVNLFRNSKQKKKRKWKINRIFMGVTIHCCDLRSCVAFGIKWLFCSPFIQ